MPPTVPLFVGLDYSQHAVQVCLLDPAGKVLCNSPCPDEADRIDQLARRFGTVRGAALEACTGAADLAQELADRFGWPMHLGHPGFVSRMKQSPDKSDLSEARVLADFLYKEMRKRRAKPVRVSAVARIIGAHDQLHHRQP